MCGVAGVFERGGRPLPPDLVDSLTALADAVQHRGPDGSGVWQSNCKSVAFAHRRLAIIDLSPAGTQPMTSADGRWTITYNGELYNIDDLRRCLGTPSAAWRGHSDTEVLVEAIARWGVEPVLKMASGMFAFAVWDARDRELWLARDRFGEKPLYYGDIGGRVVFGSELRALRAVPGFTAEIDREAVALLLRYGVIPAPYSIYRGVHKLPAGSYLRVGVGGAVGLPTRYWDPVDEALSVQRVRRSDAEALDELDELLQRVVRSRMVADVPLGAFLSGGVDSSLVVAMMLQVSSSPVKTFTVGFEHGDYDESGFAAQVARHLGTDHTEVRLSAADALAVVPRLGDIYDEPFADSSQIPTYLVSGVARRHVTVALSGDGGDELFGGYDRYRVMRGLASVDSRAASWLARGVGRGLCGVPPHRWDAVGGSGLGRVLPGALRRRTGQKLHKLGRLLGAPVGERYATLMSENASASALVRGPLAGGVGPYVADARFVGLAAAEKAMLLDALTYLPDDVLTKVDRASMAHSLEVRVPLLDVELFRFAWSLEPAQRLRGGQGKWLLRELLKRYVPSVLVDRPKMGFGVPVGAWLRGELCGWAEELLASDALGSSGLLEQAAIDRLWRDHLADRADHAGALWAVLALAMHLDRCH